MADDKSLPEKSEGRACRSYEDCQTISCPESPDRLQVFEVLPRGDLRMPDGVFVAEKIIENIGTKKALNQQGLFCYIPGDDINGIL